MEQIDNIKHLKMGCNRVGSNARPGTQNYSPFQDCLLCPMKLTHTSTTGLIRRYPCYRMWTAENVDSAVQDRIAFAFPLLYCCYCCCCCCGCCFTMTINQAWCHSITVLCMYRNAEESRQFFCLDGHHPAGKTRTSYRDHLP
jgi:hypothetical protein